MANPGHITNNHEDLTSREIDPHTGIPKHLNPDDALTHQHLTEGVDLDEDEEEVQTHADTGGSRWGRKDDVTPSPFGRAEP